MNLKHSTLLKDFCSWLKDNKKSDATITSYKTDVRQLLTYLDNEKNIAKENVETYLNKLVSGNSRSKSTIDRKINTIRQFVTFLNEEKNFELNIKYPDIDYQDEIPSEISTDEITIIRNFLKDDIENLLLFELPLQTGLKIEEITELRRNDIDLESYYIEINCKGNIRKIPLNNKIHLLIEKFLKTNKNKVFIFESKNKKKIDQRNLRRKIENICDTLNLSRVSPNTLRNTFISSQLRAGVSVGFIREMIGNKSETSMLRYLDMVDQYVDKQLRLPCEV